ncbi:3-phytase [Amycolatopsis xylanica]|uniref:3-phytase n=1 Tax=Amycolatopsis xylanica TaxID=589385 RepID=A0A1H3QAJ2_9PSEU|nr:3-phytase [Amycolatopsis xylanica]
MTIARFLPIPAVAVLLLGAAPAEAACPPSPVLQTRAFVDDGSADPANADADDPAIWVNPRHPERSVVLGALKEGGLAAFDLDARQIAHVPAPPKPGTGAAPGRFNNVDVVGDLAVVSDRGRDRIRVYKVSAGPDVLTDVTDPDARPVFSATESDVDGQRTVYGLAAGMGRLVVTTQRHEARLALLRLVDKPGGKVGTETVTKLDMPSTFALPNGKSWSPCEEPGEGPQFEGTVIDSANRVVYTAQEDVGIWRIPLSETGFGTPVLIDKVRSFGLPQHYDAATESCVDDGPDPGFGGRWLTADAEGLALDHGTLLASSQGDSRFVRYGRSTVGFRIVAGRHTDSVEHSDGATISTAYLGPRFPRGLLVVHDGERRPAVGDLPTTGFAFVPLQDVPAK